MATNRYQKIDKEIYNSAVSNVETTQRQLLDLYTKARKEMEERVQLLRQKLLDGEIKSVAYLNREKEILKDIITQISVLKRQETVIIQAGYAKTWEETYLKTGFNINVESATQFGYTFNVPGMPKAWIVRGLNEEIAGLTFQQRSALKSSILQQRVRNAVANAMIEGIGADEFKRRLLKIKGAYDSGDAGYLSAKTTARTELLKAYSYGQEEAVMLAEDAGIEGDNKWDSTLDGATRNDHRSIDGQKRNTKTNLYKFRSGETIYKPRVTFNPKGKNGTAGAGQIVNCRCRDMFLPFGIEPTMRASRLDSGEVKNIKNISFDEWSKTQEGRLSIEEAEKRAKARAKRLAKKRK